MPLLPLALLAATLYLAAALATGRWLFAGADCRRLALGLALCATALHLVLIALAAVRGGGVIDFHFAHAMSATSWVVCTLLLLLALREPVAVLGLVIFPLSAIGALLGAAPATPSSALAPGLALHAAVSVIAYGILIVSAVQACVLAVQNHRLHAREAGGFVRKLPPLASMERLLFRLIAAGFVALSAALLSGFVFVDDLFAQHLAHKSVLSLLAWGVFGALLIGHHLAGWRGRTAVRWTLAGALLLVLAFAGSKFVAEVLLGR